MGKIVISAYGSAYEWWQSLGPVGLAGEFVAVVVVASAVLWFLFRTRSSVFWKRTDYAYFLFAILGGAAGAADLALNNWGKQLEQIQLNMITSEMLLRGYEAAALSICDQKQERAAREAQDKKTFSGGVRKPSDPSSTVFEGGMVSEFDETLSDEDCTSARRIESDI